MASYGQCLGLLMLVAASRAAGAGPARPRACLDVEACVALKDCPRLAEILHEPNNVTDEDKRRLQSALCGYHPAEGQQPKTPMVCCPLLPDAKECGIITNADKGPVRGNRTYVMEFLWVVRLGYRSPSGDIEYQCGGTLISAHYVLTAARCIARPPPVTVRLGEHDIGRDPDCTQRFADYLECAPPVQDVGVAEVVAHPGYAHGGDADDVALVRLDRYVSSSDAVGPICLPSHLPDGGAELQDGGKARYKLYGWGTIGRGRPAEASGQLFELHVGVVEHAACAVRYAGATIEAARQVCVAGRRSPSCYGDAGGPLVTIARVRPEADGGLPVRHVLAGVASHAPYECAADAPPAVFSRVAHYIPWILSQLRP